MSAVDVVIPTRDRYDLCVAAVESVQRQTMTDWRLYVVDDHSNDREIPRRLEQRFAADDRVQLLSRTVSGRASRSS